MPQKRREDGTKKKLGPHMKEQNRKKYLGKKSINENTQVFDIQEVTAVMDGTIVEITNHSDGFLVGVEDEKGNMNEYFQLHTVAVAIGQKVNLGDLIGKRQFIDNPKHHLKPKNEGAVETPVYANIDGPYGQVVKIATVGDNTQVVYVKEGNESEKVRKFTGLVKVHVDIGDIVHGPNGPEAASLLGTTMKKINQVEKTIDPKLSDISGDELMRVLIGEVRSLRSSIDRLNMTNARYSMTNETKLAITKIIPEFLKNINEIAKRAYPYKKEENK